MKSFLSIAILTVFSLVGQAQSFESVEIGEGEWPDIIVDATGERFISFIREAPPSVLWMAFEPITSGSFVVEQVAQTRIHGPTQIVADNQGWIHLGLHDHNFEGFGIWNQSSSGWDFDGVEDQGHDGWDPDLKVDGSGNLHVSTINPVEGSSPAAIEYAFNSGSGWVVERVVESPMTYGYGTSLALSSQNRPRIVYFEPVEADLMLASRSSSTWSVVPVDTTGDVGRYASLAVDDTGVFHLAYLKWNGGETGEVLYAHNAAGDWTMQTVDVLENLSINQLSPRHNIALLLDDSDQPVIAYSDQKIAKIARPESVGTIMETLIEIVADHTGTDTILGQYISFAFGPEGGEHIVYHQAPGNLSLNTVMLATRSVSTRLEDVGTLPSDFSIEVYPNPFVRQARLSIHSERAQSIQIDLMDMLGRTIERRNVTVNTGRQEFVLTSGDWPAGVYVVRVTTEEGSRNTMVTSVR